MTGDVVLFRRLLSQARHYWPHVVALFLLSLLSSPLSLLTPLPLKIAVDSVIGSHPLPHAIAPLVPEAITRSPGALLAFAIGLLVAVALLRQLQGLTNTLLQAYVKEKLVQNFRTRLFRHVQRLSLAYHDATGTSDSTYRIQHDATAIQYVLLESVIPFISATVTLVGMTYVMTRIDWQLALIALAISPGLVVTGRIFRRRLRRHSREAKKLERSTMSIVQEALGALRVVKAFGQESREEERFIRRSTEGMKVRLRLASLEGSFNVLVGLATAAGMAAVLLIGVRHVGTGVLTLGELLSLITRFYDRTAGEIRLDGVDLRDFRLEDLRQQFAVVPQDPVLFSASIAENIAYAKPGASKDELIAASQAANAHEFIVRLPQGYDTQVGERGVQLSGGQRQRIAIARAFLKDSPVLILDEPTSSVDIETEAVIVEALERLQQGRTVIIISHRPTTLTGCSALLMIEQGRVVRDTTRALPETGAIQPTPKRAPALAATGSRLESLLAHPAVQAWRRLGPDRPIPDRVAAATRRRGVYRLEGVGAEGSTVIAKRCKPRESLVERTVYERILPFVHLSGPRYYGVVADPNEDPEKEVCWLFIGEIQGEQYDVLLPGHRAAAARWLGILHTEARSAADQADLSDAGPGRYRKQMYTARDLFRNHLDHPAFTADDLAFLDGLLARFDQLDEHWDRLEQVATGLPRTLLHGDFNGKNLRVQASPAGPQIAAFDWTDAGRGVPTADLAQVVFATIGFSASPDLATYLSVVRERWPDCDPEDVERLAACGTVFRALAAIDWDSHHFFPDWANWFVPNLKLYDAELVHALDRLGWPR